MTIMFYNLFIFRKGIRVGSLHWRRGIVLFVLIVFFFFFFFFLHWN